MALQNDTVLFGNVQYNGGDTMYGEWFETFEMKDGQIINRRDEDHKAQGLWIISDSSGNYWKGNYENGNADGIWQHFDKRGKLLTEREEYSIGKDQCIVKEIDYSSGKPVILFDKPVLKFYAQYFLPIMVVFIVSLIGRIFINSVIYNRENNTDHSPIYRGLPYAEKDREDFFFSLYCMYTFWFFNFKPENRRLVWISNTMSALVLIIFFGLIIGLSITGDI